jgi:hypothetical protein
LPRSVVTARAAHAAALAPHELCRRCRACTSSEPEASISRCHELTIADARKKENGKAPRAPMDKTDKIFVAGHRGLAGSAIARKLEADGFTT